MSRAQRKSSGFTLIEVLIVVVILGVLAAIVVIAVGQMTADSAKNACATEAKTFNSAVQSYRTSPAHLNALPPGHDLNAVAATLYQAGLLSSASVKYGVTGGPTPNHWGYAEA